ncbi:MAG: LptF/LptG family permease [Candidatus Kapabacteria bacterium]|nr:LptF/LptG family permease [Candidatus Kapabacteria bacterium]
MIRLLDFYVIRQFLLTLLFSLIALCLIFLVVNLIESLDDFLDQSASFTVIAKYYLYYFPEILKFLTPVAILVASLFSVGRLSTLNEITAMKTGGMSLFRFLAPFIIICFGISVFQLYFNGWIVPAANQQKLAIEAKYLNKSSNKTPLYDFYYRDNPLRNVNIQYYDASAKEGSNIYIEDFTSLSQPRMKQRTEAKKLIWDSTNNKWQLINGFVRVFNNTDSSEQKIKLNPRASKAEIQKFDTLAIDLSLTHNEIVKLRKSVDEMNYDELKEYILLLQKGGKDVRFQLIKYYSDYAFAFADFIVILFAVPFASIRKRGGLAIQLTAAMIVSFFYMLFTQVGQTVGYATNLNPELAGWMPNIIFLIAGIFIIFRTRT